MTKLMEWLLVFGILTGIWACFVTKQIENDFTKKYQDYILVSPIIFVILFGLYAMTVVLYRVFTFNNCEEAAKELQEQIIQAKQELTSRGIKFTS